jgi:hypothetical protein
MQPQATRLPIQELAERLGLPARRPSGSAFAMGDLCTVRCGKHLLVPAVEVEKWLAN